MGRARTKGWRQGQELRLVRGGGELGQHRSCGVPESSKGQGRILAQVLGAAGATGSPKRSRPQAEAAVPEALPEAFPAAAAAMVEAQVTQVTLRELQEALEEEVLTRQSLSQELEAIRTANQNFARSGSGSGRWAGLYRQQPVPLVPECSRPLPPHSQLREAEARNQDLEARVQQLQERMELLQAGADAGESLMRLLSRGQRGEGGPMACVDTWGRARGPGWGTPRHRPPPSLHAPYASLFSFQLSRGSPVPGPRMHLPM